MDNESDFLTEDGILKKYMGTAESVIISNEISEIETGAFSGIDSLRNVRISGKFVKIREGAFQNCENLQSVQIEGEPEIGRNAWENCPALEKITLQSRRAKFHRSALREVPSVRLYAPDLFLADFPGQKWKLQALIAFCEAVRKGEPMPEDLIQQNRRYIKTQRKRLYRDALHDERILHYMMAEKLIGREEIAGLIELTDLYADSAVREQLLSYQQENFGDSDAEKKVQAPELAAADAVSAADAKKIWQYEKTECGIRILGYRGSSLDIVIPARIGSMPVTEIGPLAFSPSRESSHLLKEIREIREKIRSVRIPAGVQEIGSLSFVGCRNLEKIILPDTVRKIGESVFSGCSSLKKVALPPLVTEVPEMAFYKCSGLVSVQIQGKVVRIGEGAFCGCSSLPGCSLPESVEKIEGHAFHDCISLEKIKIPWKVSCIAECTFQNCAALSRVIFPENLKKIGAYAFQDCVSLRGVIFPPGLAAIESAAFGNCRNLTDLVLPESLTSIGYSAFSDCKSLTRISIPQNVRQIGEKAFLECTNLSEVNVAEGTSFVMKCAFWNCRKLSRVVLPQSVAEISWGAFWGCDRLTISAPADSYAETYAKQSHIPHISSGLKPEQGRA